MALVCALTGVAPEEPVFSRTNHIFERRAIEKYLRANNNICPITHEELTPSDLLPVKSNKFVKPRPVAAASIPGLLTLMQNEWDSLMAEMFALRSQLDSVRNQLSHSLYQHDAACRVIARLIKERESLRNQLNQMQDQSQSAAQPFKQMGSGPHHENFSEETGVPDELIEEMTTLAKSLLAGRKKRQHEGLQPLDGVKRYSLAGTFSPHSSTSPGVKCVTVDRKGGPEGDGGRQLTASGGNDGVVVLFDLNARKTVAKLQGHLKPITQVIIHPTENVVLSASDDKTVKVWTNNDDEDLSQYKQSFTLRRHAKPVTSISLHPLGSYFSTSSSDKTWGFHDLHSGRTLRLLKDLPCEFASLSFHPDGMLVAAAGHDGNIHIYDMKGTQSLMVSLEGHTGPLTSLAFSENGYYLATSSVDGTVRLWDLRRSSNIETVQPPSPSTTRGPVCPNRVAFDSSGSYLVVSGVVNGGSRGGSDSNGSLSIYNFESKTKLALSVSLNGHEDSVTDACFGPNADFLVSSSLDRTVRLWKPASQSVGDTLES